MNHISIFTTNSIVTDKKVPIIFSLRIFMINRYVGEKNLRAN